MIDGYSNRYLAVKHYTARGGNMEKQTGQARAVSIPDFAIALGIKEPTVRAWLMKRKISKIKLGRRTLIPISEIERLLSENLTPALPDRAR